MSDLYWLTMGRWIGFGRFFRSPAASRGLMTVGCWSGIIFIQRNGLIWKHAPREYGPPKMLYNRWKRWSRMGVFATIMTKLAVQA